jgi:mannose-6-phosphate isomerase-like protein (cupin superfamily)
VQRLIAGLILWGLGLLAIHEPSAPGDKKHEKIFNVIDSGIELRFLTGPLAAGFAGPCRSQCCIRDANLSIVNLYRFALENPIDPQIGFLTRNAASGENASVNLTQTAPGAHFGAHYHRGLDEIDYVVQGQANMTLDGRYYPVQAGDLIYLPPFGHP